MFVVSAAAHALEARFIRPTDNVTLDVGEDAVFSCEVENLGSHEVILPKIP